MLISLLQQLGRARSVSIFHVSQFVGKYGGPLSQFPLQSAPNASKQSENIQFNYANAAD